MTKYSCYSVRNEEEVERAHEWQLLGEMKVSLKKNVWNSTCRQEGGGAVMGRRNHLSKSPEAQLPGCVLGGVAGACVAGARAAAGEVSKGQIPEELVSHTKKLKIHVGANGSH